MFYVSNANGDPVLARSDRLIRTGGVVPFAGLGLLAVTAPLLRPSRFTFTVETLSLSATGQLFVWCGMFGLFRIRGWASGVLAYIWLGAMFNALAVASTGIVYLAPIPLLAPATAWLAKVRLRRKPPAEAAR
ncbi:hypothetical protein ACIOC1_22990 [Streptomyces sp. NPDC088197]|uniref:hypothetical protein n=1 Tax=Streptomyces sp. NPDC088197 TaxID=3365840 RepID=UPI00380CF0CF